MGASSGFTPPTRWSSCSLSDLNTGFSSRRTDRCLTNVPTVTVGDPVCGNGIREGNEVCDCGSAQECTDPCCNPATCQLASGAQCSAGACCSSTCRFLSYGTQCRAAEGECDIAEYCPGDSGDCPADYHQRDGTSCSSNTGYCTGGMCPTHNAQCQIAFGKSAVYNTTVLSIVSVYRIAGNFGMVFNLVNWRFCGKSPNLKPANIISYTIALCRSAHDCQIKNSPMHSDD